MQTNANQNIISYDDDDDIDAYKIKINSNILLINDILKTNEKNKEIFENQIKELTQAYEENLLSNNNKVDKLKKYNETIKNIINLKQQILEMECETNDLDTLNNIDEYIKPIPDDLSILNVMKKVYTKQKENACFNETIVANNDLINTITNTSFRSWYYDATNWYFYKIKFEIDSCDYFATCKRDNLDTRYINVYALTIKYPDNFPKLTNKSIIKYNNNELKDINNEKYSETPQNIEILISKLMLIKINRCNAVPRGRKPKVSE
jgi:hypothetical protein